VDTSSKPVVVPINASQRNEQFYLVRPNGKEQLLEVERIGRDEFGVTVSDFAQRGLYRVATRKLASAGDTPAGKPDSVAPANGAATANGAAAAKPAPAKELDELIAANGPADESKLASIDEAAAAAKLKPEGQAQPAHFRWVARGEQISLSGAEVWGQDTWWWLILIVLCCLFVELTILAWPSLTQERDKT
jgi:hypothetical protein